MIFIPRKGIARPIYLRIFYGICVFFLVYWVLPSLFQYSSDILILNSEDQNNTRLGLEFLLSRSLSLFLLFVQYPFVLLPFIFVVAPGFSFILFYSRIKSESGSLTDKLAQISYEFNQSPKEMIRESLLTKDWKREKELFKAFIILLPISLYLLTVILELGGLEPVSIDQSENAMGWFIEILFVYIATFLSGFQLLASSKISFKGRFIGEQIQTRFFESLTQVGTPIAVLSLLLFIAQKTESLPLIIYFFAYFLMAAFIYIMLLRFFEPISILLFLKIINWWKIKDHKDSQQIKSSNSLNILFFGLLAGVIVFIVLLMFSSISMYLASNVPNGLDYYELSLMAAQPDFYIALLTEQISAINSLMLIVITLILGLFFSFGLNQKNQPGRCLVLFGGVLTIMSILIYIITGDQAPLMFIADQGWTTGKPVEFSMFNFNFITMRTAFLEADLGSTLLIILAIPFLIVRQYANFMLWGIFFYYIGKRFLSKGIRTDGNFVNQTTFSSSKFLVFDDFRSFTNYYVVIHLQTAANLADLTEFQQKILNDLKEGAIIQNILPATPDGILEYYKTLKGLQFRKITIEWWAPEFSYTFERAKLDGLYLLHIDGRDLLYYNFNKESGTIVEPALVSGMFSAITSFINETTRSSDLLRAIDQGEKKVILEYSKISPVFGAIFADRENIEIRTALANLIAEFSQKHKRHLANWTGEMNLFDGDEKLVEKYFPKC
jgi:hypothetical protein